MTAQQQPIKVSENFMDHDLIIKIAEGDRTALGALYDRHAARLLSLAIGILGNRDDAEDLLHDVFLEVWHKAAGYDAGRASVYAWLALRVRSRAVDRWRSLSVMRRYVQTAVAEDSRCGDQETVAEWRLCRPLVTALSDAQRTVLELHYFAGLNHREIAARCKVPLGTVKSRLSAALKALRHKQLQVVV